MFTFTTYLTPTEPLGLLAFKDFLMLSSCPIIVKSTRIKLSKLLTGDSGLFLKI